MTAHPARWATRATVNDPGWDMLALALERAATSGEGLALPVQASTESATSPQVVACALWPEPESAKAARDFTHATLHRWALGDLVEDVAAAVSELVANAIRHGLRRSAELTHSRPIRLGMLRRGPRVLCAVADPGDEVPALTEPDHLAETGRGLHVVASLSDTWGWTPADHRGKVVWASFSARTPR